MTCSALCCHLHLSKLLFCCKILPTTLLRSAHPNNFTHVNNEPSKGEGVGKDAQEQGIDVSKINQLLKLSYEAPVSKFVNWFPL